MGTQFFGRVYADVMRDPSIPPTSKAIYGYLAVLCGAGDECYPGVETITNELGISRETFYKYLGILVAAGIVSTTRERVHGRFDRTVYSLPRTKSSDVGNTVSGDARFSTSENAALPDTVNSSSNNKLLKKFSSEREARHDRTHNFAERADNIEDLQNAILRRQYDEFRADQARQ